MNSKKSLQRSSRATRTSVRPAKSTRRSSARRRSEVMAIEQEPSWIVKAPSWVLRLARTLKKKAVAAGDALKELTGLTPKRRSAHGASAAGR